jgi:hypothetical protein
MVHGPLSPNTMGPRLLAQKRMKEALLVWILRERRGGHYRLSEEL